jgi:hypothetical protein
MTRLSLAGMAIGILVALAGPARAEPLVDRMLLHLDDLQNPTVDATGRGNAGDLLHGPTWQTGKFGSALEFDGTSQYLDCGTDASLQLTTAVSIEAWICPHTLPPSSGTNFRHFIVTKGRDTDAGYHLAVLPSGQVRTGVVTSTGYHFTATSNNLSAGLNNWHHLVMTYESGVGGSVWLDGVETTSGEWGDILWTPPYDNQSLTVGNLKFGTNSMYFFDGRIDEVAVYSYALSDDEVLDHWNDGDGRAPVAVPEPSTFLLASLGLVGFAVLRRRRQCRLAC